MGGKDDIQVENNQVKIITISLCFSSPGQKRAKSPNHTFHWSGFFLWPGVAHFVTKWPILVHFKVLEG